MTQSKVVDKALRDLVEMQELVLHYTHFGVN